MRPISFGEAWIRDGRKLSSAALRDTSSDDDRVDCRDIKLSPTHKAFASHLRTSPSKPFRRTPVRTANKRVAGHAAHKDNLLSFAEQHQGALRELLGDLRPRSAAPTASHVVSSIPARSSSSVSSGVVRARGTSHTPWSSSSSSSEDTDSGDEERRAFRPSRPPASNTYAPTVTVKPLVATTGAVSGCKLLSDSSALCACTACVSRAALRAAAVQALGLARSSSSRQACAVQDLTLSQRTAPPTRPKQASQLPVSGAVDSSQALGSAPRISAPQRPLSAASASSVPWQAFCPAPYTKAFVSQPKEPCAGVPPSRAGAYTEAAIRRGSRSGGGVSSSAERSAPAAGGVGTGGSGDAGHTRPVGRRQTADALTDCPVRAAELLATVADSAAERVLQQLLQRRLRRCNDSAEAEAGNTGAPSFRSGQRDGNLATVGAPPEPSRSQYGREVASGGAAAGRPAPPASLLDPAAAGLRQAARRRAQSAVRRVVDSEVTDMSTGLGRASLMRSSSLALLERVVNVAQLPGAGAGESVRSVCWDDVSAGAGRRNRRLSFEGSSDASSSSAAASLPPSTSSLGRPSYSSMAALSAASHSTPATGTAYAPSYASSTYAISEVVAASGAALKGQCPDGGDRDSGNRRRMTALSDSSEDEFATFVRCEARTSLYAARAHRAAGQDSAAGQAGCHIAGGGAGRGAGVGAARQSEGFRGSGVHRANSATRPGPRGDTSNMVSAAKGHGSSRDGGGYTGNRGSGSTVQSNGSRYAGAEVGAGSIAGRATLTRSGSSMSGSGKGWLFTEALQRSPSTGKAPRHDDDDVSLDGWEGGVRSPSQRLPLSVVWGTRFGGGAQGASPAGSTGAAASTAGSRRGLWTRGR